MTISSSTQLTSTSYKFAGASTDTPTKTDLLTAMTSTVTGTNVVSFNVTYKTDENNKLYAIVSVTSKSSS